MAIDSDYVQSMATQLAQYEIQGAQARAQRNQSNYNSTLSAINTLSSALSTFKTAASSLKSSSTGSVLVNTATFSEEGYASATVGTKAVAGNYDFFVSQLASKSQIALSGLTDASLGSGTFKIGQGSESFTIDLAGSSSLSALATAINNAPDNTGVKATLVRSNGEVSLVLTSEETGADQAITLEATGNGDFQTAVSNKRELSQAKDAIVYLGGEGGIELTNSSNTFDNVIDGVSLTFSKVQASGDTPLNISIDQDSSATQDKLQSFLTAFNTLMSSLDSLTASGGTDSARGALASDASVRAIDSMLNNLVRTSFGGVSLIDYGVSADRNGKLTLDASKLETALANNPEGLESLFSGKGNLLDTFDKNLSLYTSSAGGILTERKNTLNLQLQKVDDELDNLQTQYDSYYNRYLRQYTNLMQVMTSMEQTSGLF